MKPRSLIEFWPLDKRGTHTLLALSALIAALVFIISLKFIFTPFFMALMLAYIFYPLVKAGARRHIPPRLSAVFIFVSGLLLLIILLFLICPSIYQEIHLMIQADIRTPSAEKVRGELVELAESYLPKAIADRAEAMIGEGVENFNEYSKTLAAETLAFMGKGLLPGVAVIGKIIMTFLLIAFYFFFLLISLDQIWDFIRIRIVPYEYRETFDRISIKIHLSLAAFFRGRLIVCLIVSLVAWIGLRLLHAPFAFIFGFGIGFATIIPLLGLAFLFPCLFFCFMTGADVMQLSVIIVFYSLVQGLEWFVLTPVILGKKVGIHPMVLVLSILICGYLFGVIGVLLAVPISSTAKILFQEFIFPSFEALSSKNPDSANLKKGNDP